MKDFQIVQMLIWRLLIKILDETLNPTWDEMLLFPQLTLDYSAAVLKNQHKMLIVVEIFDADSMVNKLLFYKWTAEWELWKRTIWSNEIVQKFVFFW